MCPEAVKRTTYMGYSLERYGVYSRRVSSQAARITSILIGLSLFAVVICSTQTHAHATCRNLPKKLVGQYGKHPVTVTFSVRSESCFASVAFNNSGASEHYVVESQNSGRTIRLKNAGGRLFTGKQNCYSTIRLRTSGLYEGFVCGAPFRLHRPHGKRKRG